MSLLLIIGGISLICAVPFILDIVEAYNTAKALRERQRHIAIMRESLVRLVNLHGLMKQVLFHGDSVALFKEENGLSDEEFASDHWQTLFAIQYPKG